jgi:hypothetical protein
MAPALVLAAILIGALVSLVMLHAIVSRAVRLLGYESIPPQTVALGTILVGNTFAAYLAWEVVLSNLGGNVLEILCGFIYVLLTYNAYCFCYFNTLNLSETSLHVNILMRLLVRNGMPTEELKSIYGVKDMISARIDRMVALGQLKEKDGRFFLRNDALVIIGRAINTWRKILGLPLSPG